MGKLLYPEIAEGIIARALQSGIHIERVGRIMDNRGNFIAEKITVVWGENVIAVFRTEIKWFGDLPTKKYTLEKYPIEKSTGIIAEINKLRDEWTSGIL